MNKFVLTTLFISLSLTSFSQILGRFYYNKNWELTKKENAVYFRVSIFDTTNYFFAGQVRDFAKSGKLLMTGTYKDGLKQGPFTFYHPDGKVESEGDYLDNKRVNTWKYYYPDGTPKQEVVFLPKGFEIKFFNDSTGKEQLRDGTGHWKEYYEEYKSPELIVNEGTFVENIKDGRWTCMLQSGKMIFIEDYKKGNLSSQWEFRDGKKQKSEFLVSPSENVLLEHFKFSLMETFSTDSTVRKQDFPFYSNPKQLFTKFQPHQRVACKHSTGKWAKYSDTHLLPEAKALPERYSLNSWSEKMVFLSTSKS